MLCNLRSQVGGSDHVIQKIETNRKASVSSTTANQLNKKLAGEVKSKHGAFSKSLKMNSRNCQKVPHRS
jgi:hypothetical protein